MINFVNFSKARALYRHGMTPLVRSSSQPDWSRLPPSNCFYYKSPRHRTSNVLSVLFTIDRSAPFSSVEAPNPLGLSFHLLCNAGIGTGLSRPVLGYCSSCCFHSLFVMSLMLLMLFSTLFVMRLMLLMLFSTDTYKSELLPDLRVQHPS